jgi:hypothetical protein
MWGWGLEVPKSQSGRSAIRRLKPAAREYNYRTGIALNYRNGVELLLIIETGVELLLITEIAVECYSDRESGIEYYRILKSDIECHQFPKHISVNFLPLLIKSEPDVKKLQLLKM